MKRIGRPLRYPVCKHCGRNIIETGETQVDHLSRHGIIIKSNGAVVQQHFQSAMIFLAQN